MSNGNGPLSSLSDSKIGDALVYGFFFAAGTALFGGVRALFSGGDEDDEDDEDDDE